MEVINSIADKRNQRIKALAALEIAKSMNRPVKYLKRGETFIQLKKVNRGGIKKHNTKS